MQDIGHTLDWDDGFTQDGQEFIILEPGIYNFTVKEFKRGRFPGSQKIPACNKAELILEINSDKGPASVKSDLIMFSSMEWKISSFLRSVGLKKHGETVKVKWDELVGKTGRCSITNRKYVDKNGKEQTANDVDRFLDPENAQTNTNAVQTKNDDDLLG